MRISKGASFGNGYGSEVDAVSAVPHSKNVFLIGAVVFIHSNGDNPLTIGRKMHPRLIKTQPLQVGRTPHGTQHRINFSFTGLPLLFVANADIALLGELQACNVALGTDINAVAKHPLIDTILNVLIKAAQGAIAPQKVNDFRAESLHNAGKLNTDVAAPKDSHALWLLGQQKHLPRGNAVFNARHIGLNRFPPTAIKIFAAVTRCCTCPWRSTSSRVWGSAKRAKKGSSSTPALAR